MMQLVSIYLCTFICNINYDNDYNNRELKRRVEIHFPKLKTQGKSYEVYFTFKSIQSVVGLEGHPYLNVPLGIIVLKLCYLSSKN